MITYYNPNKKSAQREFCYHLSRLLRENNAHLRDIVVVCIGSDRATGDCLGPLVGDMLTKTNNSFYVYGTLKHPVHACNLLSTLKHIRQTYNNPLIIAIDASLGKSNHVGYVSVFKGSIKPGIGVGKKLPLVGDISITGIVNESGSCSNLIIQSTSLGLVMNLADFISQGVLLQG